VVNRRHGFTLIEMLVASVVSLVVVAGATSVLTRLTLQHRRDRELSALRGEADFVLFKLGGELRQAGLGVPRGARLGGSDLFPRVLAGDASSITFAADLARPDAAVNGFSMLASDQGALASGDLALMNELNGDCDVMVGGFLPCETDTSSLLMAPSGASCSGAGTAPTCPWALGKYRGDEYLILANGHGTWQEVRVAPALFEVPAASSRRMLKLAAVPAGLVAGSLSRAVLSSPDRVFWRLNGTSVERAQCWGSVGLVGAIPGGVCNAGTDGTGFEPLATHVAPGGFALDYEDALGAALPAPLSSANAQRARRVHVVLSLESGAGEITTRVRAESTFSLRQ